MLYNYSSLFILFILYSFIGYLVEVLSVSLGQKKIILSRGFLIGPYLPIFGIGSIFMSIYLVKYQNSLFELFIMSMLSCLVIEYLGSSIMEKIFKLRWWDYSHKKYNVNGRICLETGILFGLGGIIVVKIIDPFLKGIISLLPEVLVIILGIVLTVVFIIDFIISYYITFNLKINVSKYCNKDATEEIKKLIREELSKHKLLTNRLVDSFPDAMDRYHQRISQYIRREK